MFIRKQQTEILMVLGEVSLSIDFQFPSVDSK